MTRTPHCLPYASLLALASAAALPAGQLVALAPISNDALKGEALPQRLKVLNWGVNETATKGVVKVGPKTLASLAANQEKFGFEEVCLDFNHNSLPGHQNFAPDPRKVAGYGKPEVIEGDGVYITALSYTPTGNEMAREYRDLSPTPLLDDSGEVIFLHSVALCPQGEVRGLSFYSASFLKPTTALSSMDYKALLLTLLGLAAKQPNLQGLKLKALSAEATDAEIQTAATELGEKLGTVKAEDEENQDDSDLGKGVKALSALVLKQGEALTALNARLEQQDREAILHAAVAAGKVVPLSAKTLPLADFRKIVEELPAGQVPLEQRTPEGVKQFATALSADAPEAGVLKALGITPEVWAKHNQ